MAIDFQKHIKIPTPLTEIFDPLFSKKKISVYIKQDYLCHDFVSGNKFRKLKYVLEKAKSVGKTKLLTFGGAYSNHIAAVAAAGNLFGFETEAFIRGNELGPDSNPTLKFATKNGMRLHFVDRTAYQAKDLLAEDFRHSHYIIPEGGTCPEALSGVSELLDEDVSENFDFVSVACGTGGTMAGLLKNPRFKGKILGFPVLKDGLFLKQDILALLGTPEREIRLFHDFHFGGYGKETSELIDFCKAFEAKHAIPLEQVYTGKMIYGVYHLIKTDMIPPASKIMIIHTGGLQGRSF
jgi:1-aminocyclopropane-1-carboxylate deaminase